MEERGHHEWRDLEGGIGLSEKSIEGIINIGGKPIVERRATARGRVVLQAASKMAIESNSIKKGNVLEASTVAALQAVKDTPRIIPHCHQYPLKELKYRGIGTRPAFGALFRSQPTTKQVSRWKR